MKIMILLLMASSCDSITVNYKVGKCMAHSWAYSGVYKVESRDGMNILMRNILNQRKLKISAADKGWTEVICP